VRVRGTCSRGHITETKSDPGRVTWHGPCATEGCDELVYAKRVPRDVRPPEVDGAQEPPAADNDDDVREVSFDVPQPKRPAGREPALPEPDPEPAGEPEDGPAVQPALGAVPVVLDEPEPRPEPQRRRTAGELVAGRRSRPARPGPATVFRHPLDW